jgi:hypothetical protein
MALDGLLGGINPDVRPTKGNQQPSAFKLAVAVEYPIDIENVCDVIKAAKKVGVACLALWAE